MRNKITLILLALFSASLIYTEKTTAQVQIPSGSNSNWIGLVSYTGTKKDDAFIFTLRLNHENPINISKWSLAVRLDPSVPVESGDKSFENYLSKINIRLSKISGSYNPTIAQIGANQSFMPITRPNDHFIVTKSNYTLLSSPNPWEKVITFHFEVLIEGGSYLNSLGSAEQVKQYPLKLFFTVYDESGAVIANENPRATFQIGPPNDFSESLFAFQVNADAILSIDTPEDYSKMVEQVRPGGLTVASKDKDYEIWVNSSYTNFNDDSNAPLVSNVHIQIGNGGEFALLNQGHFGQRVYSGKATSSGTPKVLNVRYFIPASKTNGLVKYDKKDYITTLTYTLLPN